MRPNYCDELRRLGDTYRAALQLEIGALVELHTAMAGQPALFVASGGGLAVAQVAAECHVSTHGELAMALTPLSLVGEATVRRAAVVAISARAAHPDVAFALRAARTRHNYPVVLVTHRVVDDLDPALLRHLSSVVHVPEADRDGFLATNSVLALATLFIRASDLDEQLPFLLPQMQGDQVPVRRSRCLVLYGPGQRAAAIDFETRLSELGLASTQLADYRNFAHGRHTGFSRNIQDTTVVAFAAPATEDIAQGTLATLPPDTDIIRLFSSLPGRASVLDLLTASMRVVGATAERAGVEPAKPNVPAYGRRLYHLAAERYTKMAAHGPVERKLAAIGRPSSGLLRDRYARSLDEWVGGAAIVDFAGVVIDYDGTVCATRDRFDLPTLAVREQLVRLVEGGCWLGFASGRGRSLRDDLRRWMPQALWPRITLGLYNGALLVRGLDSPLPTVERTGGPLAELRARLAEDPLAELVKMETRAWQLSVEPVTWAGLGVDTLTGWIADSATRSPQLALKWFRSGHAVDVVELTTSKVSVVDDVEAAAGGPCLAIGDRGDVGGNDFELLSSRCWTMTVDRCSGDHTRCWNLAPAGVVGPEALTGYLRRLQRRTRGWRFRPPTQ